PSRDLLMAQLRFHESPGTSDTVLCFANSPIPFAKEKSQRRDAISALLGRYLTGSASTWIWQSSSCRICPTWKQAFIHFRLTVTDPSLRRSDAHSSFSRTFPTS